MDAASASSTPSAPRQRAERARAHRGLTCANCRARKTRCDGTQPRCKTCEVYQDECRYERPPPMSQIVSMARRLQEAEQTVAELRRALDSRPAQPQTIQNPTCPADPSADMSTAGEPSRHGPVIPGGAPGRMNGLIRHQGRSPSKEPLSEEFLSDLSLDEHGKISYHGPTSAIHDPLALEATSPNSQQYDEQSLKSNIRSMLTSNAEESRAWEEFALGNASLENEIPTGIMSKLLHIHWVWIAPMFMWVYRPAFMRDMTTGGPYYSPFLLMVLCGHAARFHDAKIGEMLTSRARLLLGAEIQKPSAIPTVQGLLQLSARELAFGSTSQSWLYSGMAFRMVSDLGLHHNSGRILSLGHLSPEDLEIRRRLFWSCYFWDKAISLYLGRAPALTELPFDHTPEFYDDYAENEYWSPHQGGSMNLSLISAGEYPPMKAHSISCFENSCRLAVILNDIICELYSRRDFTDNEDVLKGIRVRLDEWREKSPAHLKYDPDNLPQSFCPPPHILAQNMLYYTIIILLHRPFYSAAAHHVACRSAADSLEKLLLLLEKTFGFSRITYLMAYCIYTGASVMTHDVKTGDVEAGRKMQTFLRALRHGKVACPLLQRSLDIVTNSLRADSPHSSAGAAASATPTDGGSKHHPVASSNLAAANYLPAFPYLDMQVGNGFNSNEAISLPGMDLDAFSILDCFPENHIDTTTAEWYMPP